MMKDWLDASLFYVSNEPGFRVNTNPRRTHTISLSSSMMYIRQIQILVQAQICTWLIVYTKKDRHYFSTSPVSRYTGSARTYTISIVPPTRIRKHIATPVFTSHRGKVLPLIFSSESF